MKEDDILEQIGRHVREEQKDDAALERIARGEEVPAELRERAERDPEVARAVLLAEPLGEDVEARIAARHSKGKEKEEPGKVVPLLRRASVIVAPLALVAGVFLVFSVREPSAPSLPGYSVTASGEQEMRGDTPAASLAIGKSPSSRFEIVARPDVATVEKVVAYAFTMQDGEPSPLDAKVDFAEAGSVRFTGTARALEGSNEVRIVLGTTSSISKFDDALSRARTGTSDERVRVLRIPVTRR